MRCLSVRDPAAVETDTILVLIEQGEDYATVKELVALFVQDADLFESGDNVTFVRDGVQERTVAVADREVGEESIVDDPARTHVLTRARIFAEGFMVEGNDAIEKMSTVDRRFRMHDAG